MAKKKSIPLPATEEIRDVALLRIRETVEPVTARQLSTLLSMASKIPESVLVPILDECVATGRIHSFSPATAKGKPRYWDRDLIEWSRLSIERSVQKKGPQTVAKLRTMNNGLSDPQFKQVFQSLIETGRLREHPPVGKSKTLKYGTEPPACEPYLKDVGKSLARIVSQLTSAGVDSQTLAKAVAVCLKEAGIPTSLNGSEATRDANVGLADLDLLMLMKQIEPGAERGALVTARELRRAANLDKLRFDQSVLELARQGRIMLHRHDHAAGLSVSERDELVTDGAGAYYVGMALRRVDC